ncbi:MAG TPA: hypothetical protein VFV33_22420 [Gemmatimonadaceae bacterium]|nr:hypothetical protein [Gemmatimonadaceae bacterium]
MAQTEYGTRADELTRALECGPPYVVRYTWAGGFGGRERDIVTQALAACFGVETLSGEQTIAGPQGARDPLPDRVKYLFWLLRVFDLSLGFTHGWDGAAPRATTIPAGAPERVYRFTVRIDRSRHRASYDD